MKHAALLAALILAPGSAMAQTLWTGDIFLTPVEGANCVNSSGKAVVAAGDYVRAVFRPAGAALGNSADSYLALLSSRGSYMLLVPGNSMRAGVNYGSSYIGSSITFGSGTGAITGWTQSPTTLSTSSNFINLSGTITKMWNISACTVTLRGLLVRAL